MPQIDSLLALVDSQGANELRLGSDKAPAMLASGSPKKLTIPATSTDTLRELFGELLDETRLAQLDRLGRVEFAHEASRAGRYRVTVTKRPGVLLAFDAILLKSNEPIAAAIVAAPPAPRAAPPPPPPQAPTAAPSPNAASGSAGTAAYRSGGGLMDLVQRALSMGASDLHLADREPPMARIHGQITPLGSGPLSPLRELCADLFGAELDARLEQLTSFDASLDLGGGARGRVNVYVTAGGLAVAIRLFPRGVQDLAQLGFPLPIGDLALLPHGLVLVVGATGSGKSTTLASLTQVALDQRSVVLVTLEDPIEFVFEARGRSLVRQRQIGRDVRDFATGLRDALREDPDVLLIGEMRDAESIQLALTAAETGHLVLASLHSRSAANAVERIIDTYPPEKQGHIRVMLSDSLRAVVAQRLVPQGSGRVLAAEILRVNTAVASAIREGKLGSIKSSMQAGRGDGMVVLERSLAELVKRGEISLEAARAAANDPASLGHYLGER